MSPHERAAGSRGPAAQPAPGAMTPPPAELGLFRTLPGRFFLLSAALLAVLWIAQALTTLPVLIRIFHTVVSIAFLTSGAWVLVVGLFRNRHRLFWRVRLKLVTSYVLLGVIPVALVFLFALATGFVLYNNVAAYVFHEGVVDLLDEVHQAAATAADEIGREPTLARSVLDRKQTNLGARHHGVSVALVPVQGGDVVTAGVWAHEPPPRVVPAWVVEPGFIGVLGLPSRDGGAATALLIRAAVPTARHDAVVIIDLPVDANVIEQLRQRTGATMLAVTVTEKKADRSRAPASSASATASGAAAQGPAGGQAPFQRTVAFLDAADWNTGAPMQATVALEAPVGGLYQRVVAAQPSGLRSSDFIFFLVFIGVFFLIVQVCALIFGVVLARSITHAVHELFVGTERVQQGDFSYRIRIESQDQLGELAASFNGMIGGLEHALHVQREKQRLDDELRIAREIQKSLLPACLPELDGLSLADLCEPAREVGGDYYDFFRLGPRRLGLLVADVSGKGTSAALYMAELKGLMLALSHIHPSPKQLLTEMNHLLADHLDNRSFITMTYAVIDLDAMTLTHARAGHTPLLVVTRHEHHVLIPDGMVLGLRLPGASERFADMLEEHTCNLAPGDVIVLYTDGVTEATNANGDLFGDDALARVVSAHRELDAPAIRERVLRDVRAFVGDADPHDDMTMIVVKMTGQGEAHV